MIKKKTSKKVNGVKYPKPKLFKPTKKETKKATQRLVKESLHKDTKSHNVKINVLSGIKENLEFLKDRTKFNDDLNKFLHDLKNQLKNKYLTLEQKNAIKKHIKHAKKQQIDNRKIINLLKKTI